MDTSEDSALGERKVGVLLFLGIFAFPIIFVWCLLRNGHTAVSRVLGFGWLIYFFYWAAHQVMMPTTAQSQTAELLRQSSVEINKTLPKMVDSNTRFDSTSTGPENEIRYDYTVMGIKSQEAKLAHFADFARYVTKTQCDDPNTMILLSSGATKTIVYKGTDGGEIVRVPISQSICASLVTTTSASPDMKSVVRFASAAEEPLASQSAQDAQQSLESTVDKERRSLPQMVSDGVRADTIEVTGSEEITWGFTLLSHKGAEVEPDALKSRERILMACAQIKTIPEGLTNVYKFKGSDRMFIASIKIDAETCDRPAPAVENSLAAQAARDAQESLESSVDRERRSLPRIVADGLLADTIEVTGSKEITYGFTFLNHKAAEIDQVALKSSDRVLAVCAQMKTILSDGVTYVYEYKGSDGGFIASIRVNTKICKGDK